MKKSLLTILLLSIVAWGSFAGEPGKTALTVETKPIYLTRSEFIKRVMDFEKNKTEWIYKGDKPAIIDFYADWCGPCKKVAPVLEELAGTYAGKVYIYKVNIDKEPELAGLFGVKNIPTFLVIPMKGKPTISSGASASYDENKTRFKTIIDDLLK